MNDLVDNNFKYYIEVTMLLLISWPIELTEFSH